ncbi:MAG TPA: plastocyanin/azurin family copper-binding protein [Mucilaginibacter sp.]|jgi:azurin
MKRLCLFILIVPLLICSCGQGNGTKQDSNTEETDPSTIPGIDKVALSDTVKLQASDDMHFDKDLFKIKSGKKITLILKNVGAQTAMPMSHNVVVLAKGTDIPTFADSARLARSTQFIPASMASSIIAHTNLVSAGKSQQVEFTISKPGVYDFICSFEGHWGTMQGKIVAE